MYTDTHCHLDFPEFDTDRDELIRRSFNEGIDYIINIGSSLKGSTESVELAGRFNFVYATVGIHPHEADRSSEKDLIIIKELAKNKKVVAIGEIGLDYYRNFSEAENQKSLFSDLVKVAKDFNLPLVIHNRQSDQDTLEILKKAMPLRAVVHCFSGSEDFLKGCLDLGFFVSFTCNITYKKAQNLREMIKAVPLERIFLETDAPYLSPEGLRGRRNEPLNVKYAAQENSRIKEVSIECVAEITSNSAKEFFKLP
jgi:TatD DNase family protein